MKLTNKQLDEWLAVEVMEWILDSNATTGRLGLAWYCDQYTIEDIIAAKNWQPCTDLNQAWECAKKWQSLTFGIGYFGVFEDKFSGDCFGIIQSNTNILSDIRHVNPARAICEAIYMAKRGEE